MESKHWIITATVCQKCSCVVLKSELFVLNTDTQVVTSGECGNISESDQRDLEGLHKICHIFLNQTSKVH